MAALSPALGLILRRGRRYLLKHSFSGNTLAPSDLGPSLSAIIGAAIPSGGVLRHNGLPNYLVGANVGASNLVIQARFRFDALSIAGDIRAILKLRSNLLNDASDNSVEATLSRSGGSISLGTRASGVFSSLGSVGLAFSDGVDYWLRVVARGTSLELLTSTDGVNFTSRLTGTSALYLTQTGVEIRVQDGGSDGNGANACIADDLLVWTL